MCCTRLYAARTTADPTVPTAALVSCGCEHRHLLAWSMNTSSPLCGQVRLVNASPELHYGSASLHHRVCALGSETLKSRGGERNMRLPWCDLTLKFLSCAVREIYPNWTGNHGVNQPEPAEHLFLQAFHFREQKKGIQCCRLLC